MKLVHDEEDIMQPPEEKKGPACTHAPAEWMDCLRCVEDFYLEKLTTEQRVRAELERPLADLGRLLRDASAVLLGRAGRTRSAEEEMRSPVQAPLAMTGLFDLVEIWKDPGAPVAWCGYGKAFSVLKKTPPFTGGSPGEVLERILIATLNELEAQKVALEARVELREQELEQTRAALLGAEYEADHLDTSWRLACVDRQRERQARRELLGSMIGRKEAESDLPDFLVPRERPAHDVRAGTGASMLETFRDAVAKAEKLEARVEELTAQKNGAYAERNELAVLVATMARALGLRAGWRLDRSAEKGWQTLVMVELPAGQVSWHLPDNEQAPVEKLPTCFLPWDGRTKAEARQRIREAIFGGFKPAPEIGARTPLSWRADLLATAPKRVDEVPCWCSLDWRGLLPDNHEEICLRLAALLRKMIEAEGGQS